MTNETREVVIHKADIPLEKGESIHQFTRALASAGDETIRKEMGLGDKVYIYATEVYKDKVIFDVYKSGGSSKSDYYETTYKRTGADKFEFGEFTKVKRKVTFTPEAKSVKKAADKTTMDVVVHKAAIALKTGETISKFTRELSEKGREHCYTKLNLTKGKDYAYLSEAFGDAVVFSTYKGNDAMRHYAFTYKRDIKSGAFEFGSLTEVERVVGFKPKTADIAKAADSTAPATEGWKSVAKGDMWRGIL